MVEPLTPAPAPEPSRAHVRLLGPFEARRADGAPVPGLGHRGVALLAVLALAEAPPARDELAALLWPGRRPEQARGSLRQELLRLRRAFGWPAGGPLLIPDALAGVDARDLSRALAGSAGLAEAVRLYRGVLLAGLPLGPDDPFARWLLPRRAALHERALATMRARLRAGEGTEALARRLLALDRGDEDAHRHLMRGHAERGDLAAVLDQYRCLTEALGPAGPGPSAETRGLLDELTLRLGPRAPAEPAGAPALDWIRAAPDRAPVPAVPAPGPVAPVDDRPSVAVLPFAGISHDPVAGDVLADGLTEEITNALAHVPGFFVTARQSALAYRGLGMDVRRIAAELGVRYLVEGGVEQDSHRIRLNIRLLDGRTGMHLWADSQGARLGDAMGLRDTIVQRIAARLAPRLMQEEVARAMRRPPEYPDAWTWLQRANGVLLGGRHKAALERVLEPLGRALEADPGYAMAHALAGAVRTARWLTKEFPDPDGERRLALQHADAALAADPENPFVLSHCAEVALYARASTEEARALIERAAQRNPNDANSLALLAHIRRQAQEDPRACLGLIADALRLSPRDPRSFAWHHYASWCHFRQEDLGAMEAACRRSIGLYGRYPMNWIALTSSLSLQEREAEAREAAAVLRRLQPGFRADGFFEAARATYGARFEGPVRQEYEALRGALTRALAD
ncbi:hypothetical protein EAH89_05400 [Roseomonas nepalensis]|uniref:Bacterial transcriptional activator domain-containing protein n=1 Tax=Muricoccus nepalensis TaxID=1854500 RepID=A0A502GG27_9PROT|nr:BTAD domain-containing putative transcriptional regulator [Roseomonas nepalensis]TPG59673.1 hypothetical protein EAH89_05400 [Roseomonas nepalensis]